MALMHCEWPIEGVFFSVFLAAEETGSFLLRHFSPPLEMRLALDFA
jgi:hypothetical protein